MLFVIISIVLIITIVLMSFTYKPIGGLVIKIYNYFKDMFREEEDYGSKS